jgi:hypothetical protein
MNNQSTQHTMDDALDIVDGSIKRLGIPTLLFISAFYLYESGSGKSESFILSPQIHAGLLTIVGLAIVFNILGVCASKLWELNMPFKLRIWPVALYTLTFPIVAIVVIAQAVAKLGGA